MAADVQKRVGPHTRQAWAAVLIVCAGLIITGAGHRLLLGEIATSIVTPLPLSQPLDTIPMQLGPWRGVDVPIEERILNSGDLGDAHLNRRYVNPQTGHAAHLFIGYLGRPYMFFAHRPEVCYPGTGWEELEKEEVSVPRPNGEPIPGMLYEFRRPDVWEERRLVLALFIVNGRYVADPMAFDRYGVRREAVFGRHRGYLTRVDVSVTATTERSSDIATLMGVASHVVEPIAAAMPQVE